MREKILQATASIIAKEGIDAVSIRYVCDKVGVKAPTIYYYFNDKEGLIDAVIALAYKKHIKIYSELAKDKDPLSALKQIWDSFFAFVEKDTELYHAIVIAHLKQRVPKEGVALFESIAQLFKRLGETNKLKLTYAEAAEIFYAAAYGQAIVYVYNNKDPKLLRSIRFTRDLCLQGLMAK